MKNLFNTISNKILINNPFLWIIGWHRFFPLILFLVVLAIGTGLIAPTEVYNYGTPFLYEFSTFIGFLSFLVFILFVIRQVKFNSFRIHHKIPYKKSITIYFNFFFFILILAVIPFIPLELYNYRVINKINSRTNNLDKDIEILNNNSFFFFSDDDRYDNYFDDEVVRESKPQVKPNIEFIADNIIINRLTNTFTYDSSLKEYPITISKTEALDRISNFLIVAKKLNILVTETDPLTIYNKRKEFSFSKNNAFTILIFEPHRESYKIHEKYSQFLYHYKKYNEYDLHDEDVVYSFLYFSVILALLLWIAISVPISDFGYAMLGGTIVLIFVGVIALIITSITNSNIIIVYFIQQLIITIFLIAYLSKRNSLISRISKILSQLLIPALVGTFYINYFKFGNHYNAIRTIEDSIPLVLLLTIVSTVFIFKEVYKNSRLVPR